MINNKNKTYINNINKSKIKNKWYIIDASNQNLGRLSSKVAYILRGKESGDYTPHINNQINIIIINSKLIEITGKKREQKEYKRHSGKPGSLKIETFNKLQERMPNKILEKSIKGMLPKNILGRQLFKQLKIYSNHIHPHSSQKPKLLNLN
uniref:Large ribosomal subunit protein uL13c n=1 Tax=Dasya naccarioides TaxID=2007180 RepID=A0A1Z1MH69_9FLOR|nr:ribosomal protein L13 [Dasya naccarioides]ARW65239.1 ribosomal protein L13 [Dasya naccarioides]